nr:hypothetical protein [Pseudonocardia nigra]
MTQKGVYPPLEPRADAVIEDLRLGVHLVPRHAEDLGEEHLEQAVPPHDPQRVSRPVLGQPDPVTAKAANQIIRLQPLQHRRDSRSRHPQLAGHRRGRDSSAAVSRREDRLWVALNDLGVPDSAAPKTARTITVSRRHTRILARSNDPCIEPLRHEAERAVSRHWAVAAIGS